MHQVVSLGERRVFTTEEAQHMSRVIFRMTRRYSQNVEQLIQRLESSKDLSTEAMSKIENDINDMINDWQEKVERLGACPKGLWLVDFDAGDGYYCWKYPEPEVSHWHRYEDGFTKRVPLESRKITLPFQERIRRKILEATRLR